MAQLTEGVKLEWATDNGSGTANDDWRVIPSITKIPELVGTPSTHDVTDIYCKMKRYIDGLPDNGGNLTFECNMEVEIVEEYEKIRNAQKTAAPHFKVSLPAPLNKAYTFRGKVSALSNNEISPDNPLVGKLTIMATTDIEFN